MVEKAIRNKAVYIVAALTLALWALMPGLTRAAALNQAGVRLGRLSASAGPTGNDLFVSIKFNTTPTSVAKVRIAFPSGGSGFSVSNGTPAVSTTGFPATPSVTALPGTLTAASSAGTNDIVISGITSASLNNTTLYGFTVAAGNITNPSSAGQQAVTVESLTSGDVQIDVSDTPVYITSSGGDQIQVNASVAANFSFSLSASSDTIPKVDPTTIQTSAGVNMVVGTNSGLGYTAYVKSANAQLSSTANPGTPITNGTFNASPDTFTAGTTKYGFVPTTGAACSTCSGSITYDAEYAGLTGTTGGAYNSTNFASFVSRSGYTNADTINLRERITVANTVGAANDYTDTLTIVAAGNY